MIIQALNTDIHLSGLLHKVANLNMPLHRDSHMHHTTYKRSCLLTHLLAVAAEICKQVECGRGECKFDMNEPLGFTCECEANWKRTFDGDDDLKFLPCVIPNCTLDYNCQPAPPTVPKKEVPRNLSALDPCYWSYCGEGNCVRNSTYNYVPICECKSGSSNLLDVAAFPCYNECTLQPDCASLGIKVANSSSPSVSGNDNSQATSFLPGKFQLMAIVTVSVGMILRK